MSYNMYMDINPIVSAECEDCGTTIIIDPSFVSVIIIDDYCLGVTMCQHCERPIITEMDKELAIELSHKAVKVLFWTPGEPWEN